MRTNDDKTVNVLVLYEQSSIVQWLVYPPVTRKTGVRFPVGELITSCSLSGKSLHVSFLKMVHESSRLEIGRGVIFFSLFFDGGTSVETSYNMLGHDVSWINLRHYMYIQK